jgi:ClpP class serine protease
MPTLEYTALMEAMTKLTADMAKENKAMTKLTADMVKHKKAMTKNTTDKATTKRTARPRAKKTATVVPVNMEVDDHDALCEAKLLMRYRTYETILRQHKDNKTNMAYPFAIKLHNN